MNFYYLSTITIASKISILKELASILNCGFEVIEPNDGYNRLLNSKQFSMHA
jgi:hypothetical protein